MNQTNTLQVTKHGDNEIVLTQTLTAPRETLFAALTQAEHLVNWMNTTDLALVACEVDLSVGGSLRYVYQRPNGFRIEVRGLYEVVEPPQRFVYTETYDFSPLTVLVTTELDTTGLDTTAGETNFTQTLRYASQAERDEDFEGIVASSLEAYGRLERYLAHIGIR
jgi:uncharacterized protein YndB with AHSA1/START domain